MRTMIPYTIWQDLSLRFLAVTLLLLAFVGCGDGPEEIVIPTVYLATGQVVDPTTDPMTELAGARVWVETAPEVDPVTTDDEGIFVLVGIPPGTHRLVADLPGRRRTYSFDVEVDANVVEIGIPLFTDAQIDSILLDQGASPWDRDLGLMGMFALRSTGVPLGDVNVQVQPPPGGELIQSGEGADPIVWVNTTPGTYQVNVSRTGFLWDGPYGVTLRPGVVTFGAPYARPNFTGFLFADSLSGAPVSGASVEVLVGETARSVVSDFLGQFNLVGLEPGEYVLRISANGFPGNVSWPLPVEEDTTLSRPVISMQQLAAASSARGGPAPAPERGHLVVDLRNDLTENGIPGFGWTIETEEISGGVFFDRSESTPAIGINLTPGTYTVIVRYSSGAVAGREEGVLVRADEVTWARLGY